MVRSAKMVACSSVELTSTIALVCSVRRALYFLVPMLYELGLETSRDKRDHLASDEPNGPLISPT